MNNQMTKRHTIVCVKDGQAETWTSQAKFAKAHGMNINTFYKKNFPITTECGAKIFKTEINTKTLKL